MKKNRNYIWIISIMLIAIFMMPMKAQADPDPRYWHWITSNDEFGYFVSTKKPTKYYTGVKQWVMSVKADGSYSIALEGFRWNNGKEYAILQFTKYDSDGSVEETLKAPYGTWEIAIPGSVGEGIWDYVDRQVRFQ